MKKIKIVAAVWFIFTMCVPQASFAQTDYFLNAHPFAQPNINTLIDPNCVSQIVYDGDGGSYETDPHCSAAKPYMQIGYTCYYQARTNSPTKQFQVTCTRAIPLTYSANRLTDFSLQGLASGGGTSRVVPWSHSYFDRPSPFVYLYSAPEGEISVTLDSELDSFSPKPAFTASNSWEVDSSNGELSVAGKSADHLFYELALNKIELSRNGRNFTSKAELTSFLKDSDFLSKLGFSEAEINNSLEYLLPQIEITADMPYYYLTVLDEEAIAKVSTITVTPEPSTVLRQYFAVYPTMTPVQASGEFTFASPKETASGFVVKETGELLLDGTVFVTFK